MCSYIALHVYCTASLAYQWFPLSVLTNTTATGIATTIQNRTARAESLEHGVRL